MFAGIGLVLGAAALVNRRYEGRIRSGVFSSLETVRIRGASESAQAGIHPNAIDTLVAFEKDKGVIQRFMLDSTHTIFGIGPSVTQGEVTRRGKRFTFTAVVDSIGRLVTYHESAGASP